jgi:hypothetical protein
MPNCLKDGWGGRCPACDGGCADPVQKAVDDYLLMERKARAWDALYEKASDPGASSVLVLRNGFTVTGESACASPENFDAEIGRKIARANAVQKVWPLMGYELRSKLAAA